MKIISISLSFEYSQVGDIRQNGGMKSMFAFKFDSDITTGVCNFQLVLRSSIS
jgi:hypothetical protein